MQCIVHGRNKRSGWKFWLDPTLNTLEVVRKGGVINLERGTFFSFLLQDKDYRLALWDGIGRYTSALS